MKKLWQKKKIEQSFVEQYCFGDTADLDNELVFYEVVGSVAQASMLHSIGILTLDEKNLLIEALQGIVRLKKAGRFSIQKEDEDVHTKVENYLVKTVGIAGKKIHTGRSRNDQVLVDLRLYSKDQLINMALQTHELIDSFLKFAKQYEFVPMPGYTHMQKAMPSSLGMWAGSFAESLLDDLKILATAYELNDQSPLGSGASYGVSFPIDREYIAKLLGFSGVQNNSLYSQMSRGKSHAILMHVLCQIMVTLSRFVQDVLLFTTYEFQFFSVDESLCTGSSIMPQKKNLDVMEYLRAKAQTVITFESQILSTISGLPSGYNADIGETKPALMKSLSITRDSIQMCLLTLSSMTPNISVLTKACTPELFATHAAFQLVKQGFSFRDAYDQVARSIHTLPNYNAVSVLQASNHVGGPGNLGLPKKLYESRQKYRVWKRRKTQFTNILKNLGGTYEK